jgi:beta-glucanase (GH16 family)
MKYLLIMLSILNLINIIKCDYTNLVWSDEFNGDTLDKKVWQHALGNLYSNNELQAYTDHNSYMANGCLNIFAKKEYESDAQYTSTKVQSTLGFQYGKIEARIKVPKGNGLWPSFWMMPADASIYGKWPSGGELDIMEMSDNMDFNDATMHYGNANVHNQAGCRTQIHGDFSADFHVYAIEWEVNEIRWYVDGQLYCTKNSWWNDFPSPAPFNQKFNLIFNLAIGGSYPRSPVDDNFLPATMQIDYVRVYNNDNVPIASVNTPNSQVCYASACPTNDINDCKINSSGFIYCDHCPAYAKNNIRCGGTIDTETCYPGACPSGNASDCVLNNAGLIYCLNCPAYAQNYLRCGGNQDSFHLCDHNGGCKNNSQCQVNSSNKIFCDQCPKGYSGDRCEIPPKRNLRGSSRLF